MTEVGANLRLSNPLADLISSRSEQVRRICLRLTKNSPNPYFDADDLAQITLLKALRSRKTLYQRVNIDAWLGRIARNAQIDLYRRYKSKIWSRTTELTEDILSTEDQDPPPLPERKLRKKFNLAVNKLSPTVRPVFLLSARGLSHKEIQLATGIKLGTIKSRLSRAKAFMRSELEEYSTAA